MKKAKAVQRVLNAIKGEHNTFKTCVFCGSQEDLTFRVDLVHTSLANGVNVRLQACEECKNALEKVNTFRDAEELQEVTIEAAVNFLAPKVEKQKDKEKKRIDEVAANREALRKKKEAKKETKEGE